MRFTARICSLLLVTCLVCTSPAISQVHEQDASGEAKIRAYIDNSWQTLSRSMIDCKSLVDAKVTTAPILYLPAGMATPAAVSALEQQCNVTVRHLPRKIDHMGDVRVADIPKEGLLYLPNRYVVPGGRFNEMYGWDSYFIILGLVEDNQTELAKGMVENFFFEIENYGAILNANRTYYLTRSQPPFLSSMIREVFESLPDNSSSRAWLARAYDFAERDYALWISPAHRAGDTGLARYRDLGAGPVPEMADDSTYYPDIIRWLLAHPNVHTGYLIDAPDNPTPEQAAELAKTSCDINTSKVCAQAHVDGHRLSSAFYHGDRAMRESGFDPSFRFGPFSGSTDEYAPVCLNSLLYKYERDMEHFATMLGRTADAEEWKQRANARRDAINKYLWNADTGMFYDYNFITKQRSSYNYITAFYPLWAGLATSQQAASMQRHLSLFEHEGGLAMSDDNTGIQWDLPYGWAPTNWLAVKGLAQYGFTKDAERLASKFNAVVLQNFLHDHTIREKYDVVEGSANVAVATGYKSNVVGFGWTNAVFLKNNDLLTHTTKTPAPEPQAVHQ